MIPVESPAKPIGFVERVEQRGAAWLSAHPNAKRPLDYWSEFKDALAEGFGQRCGYCAMFEPVGTVDHFVSWDEDRSRAYEWANYRFASAWINSSKQNLRADQVLDPFEVQDGWFEVLLPSLELVVSSTLPEEVRERANIMLTRLHLRNDRRVIRQRSKWYELYKNKRLDLEGLREMAPLIASAVEKQHAEVGPDQATQNEEGQS